jgi:indole-3-glycerol phosphate synthase
MRTEHDDMQRNTDILQRIIEHKRALLPLKKGLMPAAVLERYPYFERKCIPLSDRLLAGDRTGIIAEFKRKSPSKGVLNADADPVQVAKAYEENGASAISVLTDEHFFGGSAEDLMSVREAVSLPLLRKDFVIDEYQLLEAKAWGADLVLLIAACLTSREVRELAQSARMLGMQVLLELHDEEELGHVCEETELIGINNRDLRTFEVDVDRSLRMAARLPAGSVKVAESGIHSAAQVHRFRENGFHGFLMGEQFMKAKDPGGAFREFVSTL